jgi:iron complex outermembrane receptor protein
VFDLDARYDLTDTFGIRDAFVQLNVSNIFEEEYLANISTSTTGNRTASLGSPRTAVISIGTSF